MAQEKPKPNGAAPMHAATRVDEIRESLTYLRLARSLLQGLAPQSCAAVRRAMKSTEGALRHALRGLPQRQQRASVRSTRLPEVFISLESGHLQSVVSDVNLRVVLVDSDVRDREVEDIREWEHEGETMRARVMTLPVERKGLDCYRKALSHGKLVQS